MNTAKSEGWLAIIALCVQFKHVFRYTHVIVQTTTSCNRVYIALRDSGERVEKALRKLWQNFERERVERVERQWSKLRGRVEKQLRDLSQSWERLERDLRSTWQSARRQHKLNNYLCWFYFRPRGVHDNLIIGHLWGASKPIQNQSMLVTSWEQQRYNCVYFLNYFENLLW